MTRAPGRYRRALTVQADEGVVRADMEDDVHHFRLRLRHDGTTALDLAGEAIRTPYTVCPGALAMVGALAGRALAAIVALPAEDRFQQCMHLHDLAALAARRAGHASFRRLFRIEVDHDRPRPLATLSRDGRETLRWTIDGDRIVGGRYDGVTLAGLARSLSADDPDAAEEALLLRRASLISFVRRFDLDAFPDAAAINPASPANCFAKQPDRRDEARRNVGTTRDFFAANCWPLGASAVQVDGHEEERRPGR